MNYKELHKLQARFFTFHQRDRLMIFHFVVDFLNRYRSRRYYKEPYQPISKECHMKRTALFIAGVVFLLMSGRLPLAAQADGAYKVLKTAKVGGEGGTDYIYADTAGRRIYITRGSTQSQPATATSPELPAFEKR